MLLICPKPNSLYSLLEGVVEMEHMDVVCRQREPLASEFYGLLATSDVSEFG